MLCVARDCVLRRVTIDQMSKWPDGCASATMAGILPRCSRGRRLFQNFPVSKNVALDAERSSYFCCGCHWTIHDGRRRRYKAQNGCRGGAASYRISRTLGLWNLQFGSNLKRNAGLFNIRCTTPLPKYNALQRQQVVDLAMAPKARRNVYCTKKHSVKATWVGNLAADHSYQKDPSYPLRPPRYPHNLHSTFAQQLRPLI